MKLYFGAFTGVLLSYSLAAQTGTIPSNITDPVLAAEEAQDKHSLLLKINFLN